MINQEIINLITFAIAVVGALLGIINTVHNLDKDRVKIRVQPVLAIMMGIPQRDEEYTGVQITNLSSFSISIHDVGFLLQKTDKRAAIVNPLTANGEVSLPFELGSRKKETFYTKLDSLIRDAGLLKCAYCFTSCGTEVFGNSKIIKQINEKKLEFFLSQSGQSYKKAVKNTG